MPSSYNIGPHYEDLVRALVKSGRYASASEVVRDSLRLLEQREEIREVEIAHLKKAYEDGMASGDGRELEIDSFLAELKSEARSRG